MTTSTTIADIQLVEEHYPRYDPAHGTPDPMIRRLLTMTLPAGTARFEQTDYGHPGRFNPWDPRGIDPRLQARTAQLLEISRQLGELLT